MADISQIKDRKTNILYNVKDAQARAALQTKQDTIQSVIVDYQEDGGSPDASAEFNNGELEFTMKNMKMKFSELTASEKAELKGEKGDQGDSAVYNPEDPDAPDFEMANTTGQSTTKAMTQKAVTDLVTELKTVLNKFIGLTASITIPAVLPAGYTPLLYIANISSSGGYIDTGIKPDDNSWRFEGSWMLMGAVETYQAIMAAYSTESANTYRIIYNGTSITSVLLNANTLATFSTTLSVHGAEEWNTFIIQYGTATINGTAVSLGTTSGSAITRNVYLFSSGETAKTLVGRMGRFKAWHNDVLTKDMIPCINPQSVYGMYDIVNDVFYGSSNANNFTGGN